MLHYASPVFKLVNHQGSFNRFEEYFSAEKSNILSIGPAPGILGRGFLTGSVAKAVVNLRSSPLRVALACDDSYAMPLATTLRSLVDSNRAHWPIEFFVLDDGISLGNKKKIEASLPPDSARCSWLPVTLSQFDDFSTMQHISPATFARILLPELLPADVERVLFLDCDVLVLGDLQDLWQTGLNGYAVGAVANIALATVRGIGPPAPGSPAASGHFNAGVLLIDIQSWNETGISERAVDFLRRFPDTPYSDQDALNFACGDDWVALSEKWNFQDHFFPRFAEMDDVDRPAVVHFITEKKPWLPAARSRNAAFYDSFRSRTLFARSFRERVIDGSIRFLVGCRNVLRRISKRYFGGRGP